ncbi:MAG TPA: retropepsin-like aspartic protease [Patescibacteria group bacterium]|nr:retropepsin-like aspartic protease [Patescibacteria group bacterium]
MKFDYTWVVDDYLPGGKAYLPLLDVNLGTNKLPIKCLIDSGSPVCIIHSPLAVAAGIIPAKGKASSLLGIGGEKVTGYYQRVEINVYGYRQKVTAFLTADLRTPYCLLGQIGFFEKFRVVFELMKERFEVTLK